MCSYWYWFNFCTVNSASGWHPLKLCVQCYTVHSVIRVTFLLWPTWYTNFLFIHTNYIKLNSSTCFERNPLIIRSTTQIVHMHPLVSSLSASDRLVQPLRKELAVAQDSHLQRVTIPEAAYVQFTSLTSWWWAECVRNM